MAKKFRITRDRRFNGAHGIPITYAKTIKRWRKKYPIARKMDMSGSPFPAAKYCKLNYFDIYTIEQNTGTSGTYQFRLNALQDWDYTSSGHQPYYYDQVTPMYGFYKVYGVKINYQYTCINGSDVPQDSMLVIRPTADGTTPTPTSAGFVVESERPNAVIKTYAAGGPALRGILKFSPRKILGYSKFQYDDDDTTGAPVTTYPNTVAYLNILPLATPANAIHILRVKATFFAKFYQRKVVSQS